MDKLPNKHLSTVLEQYKCKIVDQKSNVEVNKDVLISIAAGLWALFADNFTTHETKQNQTNMHISTESISAEKLLTFWMENVDTHMEQIDPEKLSDWYELSFGFALGHGATIDLAKEFAELLRKKKKEKDCYG